LMMRSRAKNRLLMFCRLSIGGLRSRSRFTQPPR
jgi:hypothetical protein